MTRAKSLRWLAGFSIPEAIVALGVGSLSLSSAMLVNSHELRLVKSTRETSSASMSIEERVEQLRISNWRQMTDAAYLSNTFFATLPKSVAPLDDVRERITVSAWPGADACEPLVVEKAQRALPKIITPGAGLIDQRMAKVDVSVTWRSKEGRLRTRDLSTVISNGGISRVNLPAMGAAGGASGTADSLVTSGDTATATDSTSSTTTTTDEDPSKSNGRGTVGGKVGKK